MSLPDVLFVLPNTPEPRNENIINLLKDRYKVDVMYWKKTPTETEYSLCGCTVHEVKVKANDHNPLKRFFPMLRYFRKAEKILKETKPRCIHVSKFDSMYMVYKYVRRCKEKISVFYDVSDLHTLAYNDSKKLKDAVIRKAIYMIEKRMSKVVDYLVVTSPKFFDEYYCDFYSRDQLIFVPNAPDTTCFDTYRPKEEGPYTVGFIGSVRYYDQLVDLVDVSEELGVNVLIAGSGIYMEKLKEYSMGKEHVYIHGKYNYTKEIASLYSKIDCVFALYDTSIKNVGIALPNKLYEGAYCDRPFIAAKNCYLAEILEEYGIGTSAEDGDKEDLKRAITEVMNMTAEKIAEGCKRFTKDNSFIECAEKLVGVYSDRLDG